MPVNFYLDSRCNKHGEQSIRASFCCRGRKWVTSVGLSLPEADWADGKVANLSSVNSRGISGLEIQQRLDTLRECVRQWECRLRSAPSTELLKTRVRDYLGRCDDSGGSIKPALNVFLSEQAAENQWSAGTVASLRSFGRHLERFRPGVTFDFFNTEGISRWLLYLRSSGMEESTVRKEFQHLRWLFNWALRQGYTTQNAVCTFKPKFKIADKPVIFLTREELMRLYNLQIPDDPHAGILDDVRNCFCFCAFTSLRFSDMQQARWSDIDGDVLYVTTQKTFDRLTIDLCSHARKLLQKYPRGTFPGDRIFPQMSNRKMNLHLRRLCAICGIDTPISKVYRKGGRRSSVSKPKYELIGTHAARRTFICFALSSGIPPQVVMKWTGHSDYRSMRPYIDIAADTRADAMKRLDGAWGGAK